MSDVIATELKKWRPENYMVACPKCSRLGERLECRRPEPWQGRHSGRWSLTSCCSFSFPLGREWLETEMDVVRRWREFRDAATGGLEARVAQLQALDL